MKIKNKMYENHVDGASRAVIMHTSKVWKMSVTPIARGCLRLENNIEEVRRAVVISISKVIQKVV